MIEGTILDVDILRAVNPSDLSLYLRSLAWTPEQERGGVTWVKDPHDDDSHVVFVPKSAEMKGYVGYIGDAIERLSELQDRSRLDVLLSVRQTTRDVQFVRTLPDSDSGTTPLMDGASSVLGIQQWVLSAAVSESQPRKSAIQPARKPVQATDFMNTVKLGATYPGSFVFSVYIPIPIELGPTTLDLTHPVLDETSTPFARRVSLRLREATELALNAATEVATGTGGYESFSRNIEGGISANFCESLTTMAAQKSRPFSIEFEWAAVRPVESRRVVTFQPTHLEVLGEAARTLRAVEPEEDVQIIGGVVRLHRDSSFGPGEVSILGYIEDDASEKICRVWVELAEEDYTQAVIAHDRGLTVGVRGDLRRSGNRTQLVSPKGFRSWNEPD
jgi:hypothetical protein